MGILSVVFLALLAVLAMVGGQDAVVPTNPAPTKSAEQLAAEDKQRKEDELRRAEDDCYDNVTVAQYTLAVINSFLFQIVKACGRMELRTFSTSDRRSLHKMDRKQCCLSLQFWRCRIAAIKKYCPKLKKFETQSSEHLIDIDDINFVDTETGDRPCQKWAPYRMHSCFFAGEIAGIAIGGLVGLFLLGFLCVWCCKEDPKQNASCPN